MSRKIGLVGVGVVGGALLNYLIDKTTNEVLCYDPKKGYESLLDNCEIVYISVPVPCKGFKQDLSILESAIENVPVGVPIIIRSTILPGTCESLTKKYHRSFSHVPEFLTARRANEDMIKQPYVYLGLGSTTIQGEVLRLVKDTFPNKDILPISATEAEMVKYAHNLHGAVKVTYWNGIYELCKKEGIDYNTVRLASINATGFINEMHTFVPGPDGKKGFGGTCFPVNLENFIGYTKRKAPLLSKFFQDVYCLNRFSRGLKK